MGRGKAMTDEELDALAIAVNWARKDEREQTVKIMENLSSNGYTIVPTKTIEALAAALKECADDLESEVNARYGSPPHPAMQRRYDRDIDPVVRARAALALALAKGEKE